MTVPRDPLERLEWLRWNARAKPGDTITLYACKGYSTVCDKAVYRVDDRHVWTLASMPREYGREEYRAWAAVRWPESLSDDDLGKLARGWCLRGGFAATESAAVAHRLERVRERMRDISAELVLAHAFVRDAERTAA